LTVSYTWSFPSLSRYDDAALHLDGVVKEVAWILSATDGVNTTSLQGNVALPAPDPNNFIPFASLTKDIVTGWCTGSPDFDLAGKEAALAAQLAAPAVPAIALEIVPPPFGVGS
jgi:hypothetical protein